MDFSPRTRQMFIQGNEPTDEKEEVPDERFFNNRLPSLIREDELS